jgi:hypothetical protein
MKKKHESPWPKILEAITHRILAKLFSGRFITTVLIISTYCVVLVKALDLVVAGKISKEFFMGIFAGFGTAAGSIITFYFTRKDRKHMNENGEEK